MLAILAYYAGIMLNAFATLLCSKLCWHNRLKPNQRNEPFLKMLDSHCSGPAFDLKLVTQLATLASHNSYHCIICLCS